MLKDCDSRNLSRFPHACSPPTVPVRVPVRAPGGISHNGCALMPPSTF